MGASDNAIKILGVSEQAKNATEINDGLKKIALKNENEYLPVVNKKNLGKTFVSKAMSGKATLPAAAADADDQRLGETIANSLNPASTTPTAAPSASDTGGASELGGSATSPTPAIPMSEQDTYTSNNTDTADSGGDIGSFQAADAASTTDADNTGEFQAEPIKENKLPIDDPYNDQHPQFSSLIKRLANEYGVPA